jgi:zinc finger protein
MENTQKTPAPQQNEPEIINVTQVEGEAFSMESMCPQCFKNGETRMLLTEIPFFKSVIVTSFTCPHCNCRNSEIQSSGQLADYGSDLKLTVTSKKDLQRDVVRGEWATTYLPELELEIPVTKRGCMSTVEGFLTGFRDDLLMDQPSRREQNPDYAEQIDQFLEKLDDYIECEEDILPFTFRLCDPSGNSFIQNPNAPLPDPNLVNEKFPRTRDQIIVSHIFLTEI